jgi:periplasmic mercuric ion binding protein
MVVFALALTANAALAASATVVLNVEGMTWGSWPLVVKKALEGLKGVTAATVTFRTKEAVVAYDPKQVTIEQMLTAVREAGFQPAVKTRPER